MGGSAYLEAAVVHDGLKVEPGARARWLTCPGFLVIFAASRPEFLYLSSVLPRTPIVPVIGLGLVGAGLLLHFWTRWALREMLAGRHQAEVNQHLVHDGPDRCLRHLGYAGLGLLAQGNCVGYSSVPGLPGLPVLLAPGVVYQRRVEEQMLGAQFGDQYRAYAQRTKRLIPGLG